ncbi:Ankyrin repeat domain-containing protein 1 [Hondaea fermentalgiana]|uniref:Ankyrin repeat domain-containing protein 1 n=1 Tax=Hondaea fermentalgiana TaxID=2315210 RepID=A0A2R5G6D5_9STRA|nr:Ankyrin repeat domain-containing protein 1 [Hondaea fermentalgiana]|eukprot:GBG24003.1 Ankyrin repeat domain-containing protein 1 [Hondaea fermentalgiana]
MTSPATWAPLTERFPAMAAPNLKHIPLAEGSAKVSNMFRARDRSALVIVHAQEDVVAHATNREQALSRLDRLQDSVYFPSTFVVLRWHPARHCSFVQNHPGADIGEVRYLFELGDTQRLRNEECVAGTFGVTPLRLEVSNHIVFTGTDPRRDAYSAFKDAGSEKLTSLYKILHAKAIDELYICGDSDAVRFTAMDACSFLDKARIHIVTDACVQNATSLSRPIGTEDSHNSQYHVRYSHVDDIIASFAPPPSPMSSPKPSPGAARNFSFDGTRVNSELSISLLDESVLMLAGSSGSLLTARRLAEVPDINAPSSLCGRTVLHACCWSGNVGAIDTLCAARPEIDPTCLDNNGFTPLALALLFAPREARVEVTKRLLAVSPKLRAKIPMQRFAPHQQTALMIASENGDAEVVDLLLEVDDSEDHIRCIDACGRSAIMLSLSQETESHNRVSRLLFERIPLHSRISLLEASDNGGWNALHYSARSGAFAHLSWPTLLGNASYLSALPVNALTQGAFTFLHLAAANGKFEVIRTLVELSKDGEHPFDRLADIIKVNLTVNAPLARTVREQRKTELDLAIQHGHLETARMLLRIGCHASANRGYMQELLHRLVLMGDVEACENILAFPMENEIRIDHALVSLTKRIEAPEVCTSRCSDFKPVLQFVYHCASCNIDVCLVCRERCHASCAQSITPKGFGLALCGCSSRNRWACHASTSIDPRERAAMAFDPTPLDTSIVRLSASTESLARRLARNMHNVWCKIKLEQGWQYSRTRDDARKLHPALVPFENLAPEDAKYNTHMCQETVKLIILLGFRLESPSETQLANQSKTSPSNVLTSRSRQDSLKYAEEQWDESKPGCAPIDTTKAPDTLSKHLEDLIRCISVNSHEVWAREKINQGWRYAPQRNIARNLKLNPSLVPYVQLHEDERNALREGVEQTIKSIMSLGWHIEPLSEVATANTLRRTQQRAERASVDMTCERIAYHNVDEMRVQLLSSYLLAAVRRGHLDSINIILSHSAQYDGADLNATDRQGRSGLSIAVLGGHYATARHLLALHVDANVQDHNGFTALAFAAYVGNVEMLKLLVESEVDVNVLIPDHLGFTAVHHAAARGHSDACEYLVKHLQQLYQADEVVNLNLNGVASLGLTKKILEQSSQDTSEPPQGSDESSYKLTRSSQEFLRPIESPNALTGTQDGVDPVDKGNDGDKEGDSPNKERQGWGVLAPRLPKASVFPLGRGETDRRFNGPRLSKYSPLSLAVQSGQLGTVETLIRLAANPILEEDPELHDVTYSSYYRALAQHIRIGDDVQCVCAEIQDRTFAWTFRAAGLSRAYHRKSTRGIEEVAAPKPVVTQQTHSFERCLPEVLAGKSLRELQLILRDLEARFSDSTRMIDMLNRALPVRRWRNQHATWHFFRETTVLMALLIVFAMMVPLAPDYDVASERAWRVSVVSELRNSLDNVDSFSSMQDWIIEEFPKMLRFTNEEGLSILEFNRVIGAIRTQQTVNFVLSSHLSWTQVSKVDIKSIPSNVTSALIPQRPIPAMKLALQEHAQLTDTDGLESFVMEMNVHNPLHNLHGIIDIGISTSYFGSSTVSVSVNEFRIDYGRFPPSRAFQVTLLAMVSVLLLLLARFKKYRTRKTPALLVIAVCLLIGVLAVDLVAFNNTRNLKESLGRDDFVSWHPHLRVLQMERRTVAALFFLSIIPLLQSARAIPNIGPVVVALINTFGNLAVRIYLVVVAAACFLLSFTFHVGFGSSVAAWSTVPGTFYSLFYTPFIETWDPYDTIGSESWSGIIAAACFILFATINLNLLIAIVTDVYPKEREASDSMWEQLVTAGIEMRLRAYNKRRFHLHTAEISYWDPAKILPDAAQRESSSSSASSTSNAFPGQIVGSEDKTTSEALNAQFQLRQGAMDEPSVSAFHWPILNIPSKDLDSPKLAAKTPSPKSQPTARAEDDRLRNLIRDALANGPARLSMIKDSVIDRGWSWDRARELRRDMGVLQHKQTLENGQVVRMWEYAVTKAAASPSK